MPKDTKLKKYEDVLMAALKFSDEDLAANADGQLSAGQVALFKQRRMTHATFIATLFGIVAVGLLVISATVFNGIVLMLACGLLSGLFGLLAGIGPALNINRDLRIGAQVVEGRIDLDTTAQNSASYTVNVEGKKFKVKKRAFLAFKNGDPYRIYYAPHTKTILSAEWLRDEDPFAEPNDEEQRSDAPEVRPPPKQCANGGSRAMAPETTAPAVTYRVM